MKGYAADCKKVKVVADKYKGCIGSCYEDFQTRWLFEVFPEGNKGLAKLPTAVRNKMGYAKKGSKMPSTDTVVKWKKLCTVAKCLRRNNEG